MRHGVKSFGEVNVNDTVDLPESREDSQCRKHESKFVNKKGLRGSFNNASFFKIRP